MTKRELQAMAYALEKADDLLFLSSHATEAVGGPADGQPLPFHASGLACVTSLALSGTVHHWYQFKIQTNGKEYRHRYFYMGPGDEQGPSKP